MLAIVNFAKPIAFRRGRCPYSTWLQPDYRQRHSVERGSSPKNRLPW